MYRQKLKDIDHLKRVLTSCWHMISQELINGAIGQWSKRLLLVFRSQDGDNGFRFTGRQQIACYTEPESPVLATIGLPSVRSSVHLLHAAGTK